MNNYINETSEYSSINLDCLNDESSENEIENSDYEVSEHVSVESRHHRDTDSRSELVVDEVKEKKKERKTKNGGRKIPNTVKISEALRKKRERKSIQNENGKLKEFEEIDVSTKTVIGISNLKINLDNFFKFMPITEYVKIEKKRGRKRRIQIPVLNNKVPSGSIICIQRKKDIRGVSLKKKENTGERNYFLHSVTVVMMLSENVSVSENNQDKKDTVNSQLEQIQLDDQKDTGNEAAIIPNTSLENKEQNNSQLGGKIINIKVSSNGKFQITGCKKDQQYIDAIMYLFELMKKTQEWTNEKIFDIEKNLYIPEENTFSIIFKTVMQNMDFNIGFMISRQRLDNFINKHSKYYSIFEASISGAGVNIKVKSDGSNDAHLLKIIYTEDVNWDFNAIIKNNLSLTKNESRDEARVSVKWPIIKTTVPYSHIYNLLTEKEKLKEEKKNKYHTFLVFASGSIIMTSKGPNMKEVIYELIDVLLKNREQFEEKSQLIKMPVGSSGTACELMGFTGNVPDTSSKPTRRSRVEIEFKEEY